MIVPLSICEDCLINKKEYKVYIKQPWNNILSEGEIHVWNIKTFINVTNVNENSNELLHVNEQIYDNYEETYSVFIHKEKGILFAPKNNILVELLEN